ncbi:hypothetical protein TNIN_24971 [Trichonephila inaurata madagascariensis]|uniref:Uncharacterized protein n=1 Tax=Trichonephila inaurata madagascariensis TaxID=2747483 RepID=A0A8X6XLA1_9ARAC|nr:hypothetical protein TNIN_24971 [Trichonephila inaurata madagascariensis]
MNRSSEVDINEPPKHLQKCDDPHEMLMNRSEIFSMISNATHLINLSQQQVLKNLQARTTRKSWSEKLRYNHSFFIILADLLRILQLNTNHSRSAQLQAHWVVVEMGFDLLVLQDPYPDFNLPLNSPLDSSQFFSNALSCVIVCYNRNIICNFHMKTDPTVSVNIKLSQILLTVINVYFPPHDDFSEAILIN